MEKYLAVVEAAGEMIKKAFYLSHEIEKKSSDTDLVTQTDKRVEEFLIDKLSKLLPGSEFIAEESRHKLIESDKLWVIDPIDGTTNFVHGFPFVAVSVALCLAGKPTLGMVYNPLLSELFYAKQGEGACLNKQKISVATVTDLSASLLATGFPYKYKDLQDNNAGLFAHLRGKCRGVRRAGSAALDMCYTAKGVFNGYWEQYINPWDVLGGYVIVKEAGGRAINYQGKNYTLKDTAIIAGNSVITEKLQKVIENYYSDLT